MKILTLLLALIIPGIAAPRVFTDVKDRPLTAELVKTSATTAWLQLDSGKIFPVPKTTLSKSDLKFITTWEANQLPELLVEPDFVSDVSKEGKKSSYFDRPKLQEFGMTVKLSNTSADRALDETEVIYYLVGKSTKDRSYKILARQILKTKVPAEESKTLYFQDIDNHYRDGNIIQSGHEGMSYVLLVQRKRDGHRIHLSTPNASLEDSLERIILLEAGDITDKDFAKISPKLDRRVSVSRKRKADVITIR